jgi:L-iditol 2-dehydrogenase
MGREMKAALLYGKGDLRIERIPIPELRHGEVLVRVKTALTCGTDLKTFHRGGHVMIPSLPSPFGHEFAGIVEHVGVGVEGLETGARVVAANSAPCLECDFCKAGRPNLCDRLQFLNGAYAEFIRVPASIVRCNLHTFPGGMSHAQAALTEPLACVLHGLERSRIEMAQTVCVIGLGPIGLMFVALASQKGAKVLAVGRSAMKLDKALKIGAHHAICIDDTSTIKGRILELTPGRRGPDVVIEAVGLPQLWEMAVELARKGGLVNLFGGCAEGTVARIDAHHFHYHEKAIISVFHHTPHYVAMALRLLMSGAIREEHFVTHRLPLEDLPRAFQLMEQQEAVKVAIEFPN